MPSPINLNEIENADLQSMLTTMYQDDRIRSIDGPTLLSILKKLEVWPIPLNLIETENRDLQFRLEEFIELLKPYPYPFSPLTFGQDTLQLEVLTSIFNKIKAAQ